MIQNLILEVSPDIKVLALELIILVLIFTFAIVFLYLVIKTMNAICGIERQLKCHNDREYVIYQIEYAKFLKDNNNMSPEEVIALLKSKQ